MFLLILFTDANNDNANVPFSTGVRHLTSWTVNTWYGRTLMQHQFGRVLYSVLQDRYVFFFVMAGT